MSTELLLCFFAMLVPTVYNELCRTSRPITEDACGEYRTCLCDGNATNMLPLHLQASATPYPQCDAEVAPYAVNILMKIAYNLATEGKQYQSWILQYNDNDPSLANVSRIMMVTGDIVFLSSGRQSIATESTRYQGIEMSLGPKPIIHMLLFEQPSNDMFIDMLHRERYGESGDPVDIPHDALRGIWTRAGLCDKLVAAFQIRVTRTPTQPPPPPTTTTTTTTTTTATTTTPAPTTTTEVPASAATENTASTGVLPPAATDNPDSEILERNVSGLGTVGITIIAVVGALIGVGLLSMGAYVYLQKMRRIEIPGVLNEESNRIKGPMEDPMTMETAHPKISMANAAEPSDVQPQAL